MEKWRPENHGTGDKGRHHTMFALSRRTVRRIDAQKRMARKILRLVLPIVSPGNNTAIVIEEAAGLLNIEAIDNAHHASYTCRGIDQGIGATPIRQSTTWLQHRLLQTFPGQTHCDALEYVIH